MKNQGFRKFLRIAVVLILLVLAGYIYISFYFVYSRGVKAGELNYIMQKGIIWKTNEGRLIQAGYKSGTANSIQSNEFRFSVIDPKVMSALETSSGKLLQLHYIQYMGVLPWRGTSNYIVDSIVSTGPSASSQNPLMP